MNDILELLLVATLFICVGCASLWFSFIPITEPLLRDLHNTDPLPDLDHDHTLTAARCLGACGFVLFTMLFPQVCTWFPSPQQTSVKPPSPARQRTLPDDASTAMLQQMAELLT